MYYEEKLQPILHLIGIKTMNKKQKRLYNVNYYTKMFCFLFVYKLDLEWV